MTNKENITVIVRKNIFIFINSKLFQYTANIHGPSPFSGPGDYHMVPDIAGDIRGAVGGITPGTFEIDNTDGSTLTVSLFP